MAEVAPGVVCEFCGEGTAVCLDRMPLKRDPRPYAMCAVCKDLCRDCGKPAVGMFCEECAAELSEEEIKARWVN